MRKNVEAAGLGFRGYILRVYCCSWRGEWEEWTPIACKLPKSQKQKPCKAPEKSSMSLVHKHWLNPKL